MKNKIEKKEKEKLKKKTKSKKKTSWKRNENEKENVFTIVERTGSPSAITRVISAHPGHVVAPRSFSTFKKLQKSASLYIIWPVELCSLLTSEVVMCGHV